MKPLRVVLGLSLAAALLAAALAPEASDDLVAPVERTAGPRAADPPDRRFEPVRLNAALDDVLAIRPRSADDEFPSVLSAVKPRPQPIARADAAAAVKEAEAAPQAPPLPFRVLGRYVEADVETIFLLHADRTTTVRVGDVVDEIYKVESVSAGLLTLVYLPLNQRQTLNIGETP